MRRACPRVSRDASSLLDTTALSLCFPMSRADVWIGSITATLTDAVYVLAVPPFNGMGGILTVTAGSEVLPVEAQPRIPSKQPPTYRVDVSYLGTMEQPEGHAVVAYCETQFSPTCITEDAVRISISEIFMKGTHLWHGVRTATP